MCIVVGHKKRLLNTSMNAICYIIFFGESMISKGRGLFRTQGLLEWELKWETFWLLVINSSITGETRVLLLVVSQMTGNSYLLVMAASNDWTAVRFHTLIRVRK